MVALRKDVKVGLTIGAIAVSVIGVYAGLSALAGEAPAPGVILDVQRDGRAQNDGNTGSGAATPSIVTTPQGTGIGNTQANPTDKVAARPSTSKDPWELAFEKGTLEPQTTVSPTPGKPADSASTGASATPAVPTNTTANTPTNPPANTNTAADRSATIDAINGQKTASVGDSGSINSAANPELTKNANPTTPAANAPAGPGKSHTVEPGETFSSISSEYYGDSKYYNAIISANPQVNPNKLKPGTVIQIPELAKKEPRSDTADVPATGVASTIDASKQYVVKPGDSLHRIASNLWNDSAQSNALYELNKGVIGTDPTKLKPGMVLNLPAAPTQQAASTR